MQGVRLATCYRGMEGGSNRTEEDGTSPGVLMSGGLVGQELGDGQAARFLRRRRGEGEDPAPPAALPARCFSRNYTRRTTHPHPHSQE